MMQAQRKQIFEQVWTTVRDRHFDPTFGGINWNAVKKRYAPRVAAARSEAAFYQVLSQMLGELKQSHFAIFPPDTVVTQQHPQDHSGETGLTLSLVKSDAVVTAAPLGSPVVPGMVVDAIDGAPLALRLARLHTLGLRPAREQVEVRLLTQSLLAGPVGQPARLAVRDIQNQRQELSVARTAFTGERASFGELPPIPIRFVQRRLDSGVGYIAFNIFLKPTRDQFESAIQELADAPSLILDLRGNPGGIGAFAQAIAGMLTDKPSSLGTMRMRSLTLRFSVTPQPPHYTKPLAILIDEFSLSTSELLAAGLQESGRATVIGRASAGMVLPSQIVRLPGGGRLQFAVGDYRTPRGVLVEGRGVTPNIVIALSRESLQRDPDPILTAALRFLQEKTR